MTDLGADRDALIGDLQDRPVRSEVRAMAADLVARPGVAAVLFYGNCLRDPASAGLIDLYLLTDGDAVYHGIGLSALANRVLPPMSTLSNSRSKTGRHPFTRKLP